ncbi:DNA mismatch repair protein Mlh3 isoform 2-T2 [Xenentodon cancila]
MDLEAFKVQVVDNGAGMGADDMDRVGNRYHTSKCGSVEDLDNLRWYGFRGEALASIVSLAALVEISSRTRSSVKTHVKLFKDGKGLPVFEAETARPSAGTTVVICNFFHNMPVRRKRMDAVLEGERIRHRLEAVSLMHPSVSFTLKSDCTGAMMVQLSKARDTYHRFIQIHGLARAEKLGEISYTHKQFEVAGHLGKEGHYNNGLQFLYVNDRLLLKTRVHKLLNLLLRRLSSSNLKSSGPDGQSVITSPKHKRNNELFGVYVINIKCSYSEYDICLEPAKTLIEFKDWDGVLLCVEEAVKAFLRRENLMSVFSQDDLDPVSPKLFGTYRTDQEEDVDKTDPATVGASALDCSLGVKLASELVHRKNTNERVCLESDLIESKVEAGNELEKMLHGDSEPETLTINDKEEATFREPVDGLEVSHMPNEQEAELVSVTSNSTIKSLHNLIQPVQADVSYTEQTASNRKIRLSDPFIHTSLQIQTCTQTGGTAFQDSAARCEEKSLASKCKISLEAGQERSSRKSCSDFVPGIPSKISRATTCQRLSTCRQSGSLDMFRRIYVKSDERKLTRPNFENKNILPLVDSFVLNPTSVSVRHEDRQVGELIETQEEEVKKSVFQNPPSLSTVKAQKRSKISLAAKLCHIKQHRPDYSEGSLSSPKNTSEEKICLSRSNDGAQDEYKNLNPRGSEDVGPVLGCSTNPQLTVNNEASVSSDWLHHYDVSVGKTVYVNRMTGLSRYEQPATEETQVRCTSDITNMAVSVISDVGEEYRCYPFQMDLVLPFLPKSRAERVLSSGIDFRDSADESSNSLSSLYSKWNNPVFVRPPMVGVDISSGQADGLAVKIHNILFPYRFSKAMFHTMKVIHQVDKKFLACLINTREEDPAGNDETEGNLLVLVDQHAAHERVRLENLVADSYEDDPDVLGEKRLCSSTIVPPLEISVTEEELRLLRSCQPHLRSLGLEVTFSQAETQQVSVGKVPLCFMEKESNELRRGRPSVIKAVVEEYLREQIELLRSAGRVRGTLPLTVLKVLASLACHGAIKFNDTLSRDECSSLVASLSSCQLPFQCAHGRPSIIPLVDILHLDKDQREFQKPNLQKLRGMCEAWELCGDE